MLLRVADHAQSVTLPCCDSKGTSKRDRFQCLDFADIVTYPLDQTLPTEAPRLKVLLSYQSKKIRDLADEEEELVQCT